MTTSRSTSPTSAIASLRRPFRGPRVACARGSGVGVLLTLVAGCKSGHASTQGETEAAAKARGVVAGGLIRPELFEDRAGIGVRNLYRVEPGFHVGADGHAQPEFVDTRSVLRLFFAPVHREEPGDVDAGAIPGFAAAARSIEDLTDGLSLQESEVASAAALADRAAAIRTVRELTEAVRAPRDTAAEAQLSRSLAVARQVSAAARERVIVEAFRISGKMQTALALSGYNEIGAGEVENTPRAVATFGDPTVLEAARKLVASREKLERAIDALRARVDELTQAVPADEQDLEAALLGYKVAITARLETLSPTEGDLSRVAGRLSNLPATDIDLASNEFKRGDTLKITVSTVHPEELSDGRVAADADRDLVATWVADIGRIGWHRSDSLFGILTRGDAGGQEATNWELSFAGGVTWSWYQDVDQPYGAAYSWFQPGFGIHLASLDQDPVDDVEFGVGVHLALWEGLIVVGVGSNLTIDEDHTYYMIGGDLIGWTEKITGAVK